MRLTESLEEKKALDFDDVDENMDETLLPSAWLPFNCLIPIVNVVLFTKNNTLY